jgi:hypothetical protein
MHSSQTPCHVEVRPSRCTGRKVLLRVKELSMLEGIVLADEARLLLGLEVVEEDVALLGLLTPVLDDDARAVDDLAGVTLAVDLAYPIY